MEDMIDMKGESITDTDYGQQLIDAMVAHGDYSPRTLRFYKEQCRLVLRLVEELFGEDVTPVNLNEDQLKVIVQTARGRYAVSTQKDYLIALKRMCEINRNFVFQQYRVTYPVDTRPNVDWLTFEQAKVLLDMWKMPLDDMIICLELLHGLRRVEVVRLKLKDIHIDDGFMEVTGKGRAGGKLRSVPLHPDFERIYNRWMDERNELKEQTHGTQPDNLLVYLRGGNLHQYEEIKGRAIDDRIQQLSDRAGFDFSSHTLRRTFGRELYRSGVDIVVIATIYGHASTTQTIKYLGLDLDDMNDAMNKFKLRSKGMY